MALCRVDGVCKFAFLVELLAFSCFFVSCLVGGEVGSPYLVSDGLSFCNALKALHNMT
jgi:hypothetical protein